MNKKLLLVLLMLLAVSAPDMSIKDVASYLGITTVTVRTMMSDGRLRGYRLGYRIIRFRRDEVDAALIPVAAASDPMANTAPKAQSRGPRRRRAEIDA